MINTVKNKNILVTGGSSGIGRATALLAAKEGATVGIVSNSRDELDEMPAQFLKCLADVRFPDQATGAVNSFVSEAGRIDMLVNSAGISWWKDFLIMDENFWDAIFDVNVKGTFLVTQAAARHMVKTGSGFILNISSMSGIKSGMPGASAYTASKWAIVGFSRNLHLELKQHGIRVACLCPGSTRTILHEKANTPNQDKMLDPEDIAETILFMLSAPDKGHIQLLAQPALFEDWR
jgi:3-oxoacyl-[acyl-carrier protein] reductase